ncbi:MAG TPA: prepilin-type N-terminal cleavage/methylation domain-containing protein [Verrucomicrobiae bacterium]|jgi:general secretion pathway protein G|nr:prepilin-type N-terminal cleavage/methylation domain-containing protein [Verrucomicrobiae bacterium]
MVSATTNPRDRKQLPPASESSGRKRLATHCGFTLLELMIVLSIMMILLAVAVPAYNRHVIQAKEAVLRSNVQTLDKVIQQYTLDKRQAPQSLEDLTTAGYLHEIPKDPMTGTADWDCDQEDTDKAADPQQPGITMCHSHSSGTALDGEAYSTW